MRVLKNYYLNEEHVFSESISFDVQYTLVHYKEDDSDGYHNHTEDVDGVLENQDTAFATRNVYDSRKLVHFNPLQ